MMRQALKLGLAGCCVVLAGFIAQQILATGDMGAPPPRIAAGEIVGGAASADALADGSDLLGDVLARPLFSAQRRAKGGAVPIVAVEPPPAAAMQEPPPRLAGVMMTPDGAEALFARDGKNFVSGRTGDRIGAFRILRIEDMRVVLLGPDGTVTLEPTGTSGAARRTTEAVAVAVPAGRPSAAWVAANPVAATSLALAAGHAGRMDLYGPGPNQHREPITP